MVGDKSGVILCKVFHTYKGGQKKISFIGEFVKVSVRRARTDAKLKKKKKTKSLFIKSKYYSLKKDGSTFNCYENTIVLIKRKLITRSKEFISLVDRNILRKKLMYKFTGIL
jgi:ribosomal protein L14